MTPPDTANKCVYPNDEQVWNWGNEYANQWLRGEQSTLTREQYVARKACDWQREQDALICEKESVPADDTGYNAACEDCASAIRHPIQAPANTQQEPE